MVQREPPAEDEERPRRFAAPPLEWRRIRQRLLRIAARRVPQDIAEEVVHEAILRFLGWLPADERRSCVGGLDGRLETVLVAFVLRGCVDHWRRRERRPRMNSLDSLPAHIQAVPQGSLSLSAAMEAEQCCRRLFRGRLQRAIVSGLLAGLSLTQVAVSQGIPPSEIRRIARTMTARLRDGQARAGDSGLL